MNINPSGRDTSLAKITQTMLLQLEESETLRIELFRLRNHIRSQEENYINAIRSQEMLAQKIMTQLNLTERNLAQLPKKSDGEWIRTSQLQWLSSSIARFSEDINFLVHNYQQVAEQFHNKQTDNDCNDYEMLMEECTIKFDKAQQIIQSLSSKNEQQNIQIQQILSQKNILQNQLLLSEENIQRTKADQQKIIKDLEHQIVYLQDQKIKTQKEMIVQRQKNYESIGRLEELKYVKRELDQVKEQNRTLTELHRQNNIKMSQIIQENSQYERQLICLKKDHKGLQQKMKLIIDKEERIKVLQAQRKSYEQQKENKREKSGGKKKFNLQTLQQRVCLASHRSFNML